MTFFAHFQKMSQKCEQFSYGTFVGIFLGFLVEKRFDDTLSGAVTYNTFFDVSNLIEKKTHVAHVRPTLDDCELFLQLTEHLGTLASEIEEGSDQRLSRQAESHMF